MELIGYCLFCASEVHVAHPSARLKREGDNITAQVNGFPFPELLGDSHIQKQLEAIFILRNILKIPKETLCQFLREKKGFSEPDVWGILHCSPCAQLVAQYYQGLTQVLRSERERELHAIEEELRRKIVESKGAQGPRPTSVWGRIRNKVLEENYDCDENVASSSPVRHRLRRQQNPPAKVEIKKSDKIFEAEEEVDEEDYDIATPLSSYAEAPVPLIDPVLADAEAAGAITEVKGYRRSRKGKKGSEFTYRYKCSKCAFKTNHTSLNEAHLNLHAEGSPATPCPDCLVYVMPEKLRLHEVRHRNEARRCKHLPPSSKKEALIKKFAEGAARRAQLLKLQSLSSVVNPEVSGIEQETVVAESEATPITTRLMKKRNKLKKVKVKRKSKSKVGGKRKQEVILFNPNYSSSSLQVGKKVVGTLYKCHHCPYTARQIRGIENHVKVHNPDSGAIPCEECGVHVLEKRMIYHQSMRHPQHHSKVVCRTLEKEADKNKIDVETDKNVSIVKVEYDYDL